MVREASSPRMGAFLFLGVSYCPIDFLEWCRANLLTPKGGTMNGIGLLITILFCSIVYWGTSRYYIRMVKDINAAWERNFDAMFKDKK